MKEEQVRTGNVKVNVSSTGRMWVDPDDVVRSTFVTTRPTPIP